MLHIVKTQHAMSSVAAYSQVGDIILLVEDAVYCANVNHVGFSYLIGKQVFCLREDVEARGILTYIAETVTIINYSGFVDLTVEHCPSMTWN